MPNADTKTKNKKYKYVPIKIVECDNKTTADELQEKYGGFLQLQNVNFGVLSLNNFAFSNKESTDKIGNDGTEINSESLTTFLHALCQECQYNPDEFANKMEKIREILDKTIEMYELNGDNYDKEKMHELNNFIQAKYNNFSKSQKGIFKHLLVSHHILCDGVKTTTFKTHEAGWDTGKFFLNITFFKNNKFEYAEETIERTAAEIMINFNQVYSKAKRLNKIELSDHDFFTSDKGILKNIIDQSKNSSKTIANRELGHNNFRSDIEDITIFSARLTRAILDIANCSKDVKGLKKSKKAGVPYDPGDTRAIRKAADALLFSQEITSGISKCVNSIIKIRKNPTIENYCELASGSLIDGLGFNSLDLASRYDKTPGSAGIVYFSTWLLQSIFATADEAKKAKKAKDEVVNSDITFREFKNKLSKKLSGSEHNIYLEEEILKAAYGDVLFDLVNQVEPPLNKPNNFSKLELLLHEMRAESQDNLIKILKENPNNAYDKFEIDILKLKHRVISDLYDKILTIKKELEREYEEYLNSNRDISSFAKKLFTGRETEAFEEEFIKNKGLYDLKSLGEFIKNEVNIPFDVAYDIISKNNLNKNVGDSDHILTLGVASDENRKVFKLLNNNFRVQNFLSLHGIDLSLKADSVKCSVKMNLVPSGEDRLINFLLDGTAEPNNCPIKYATRLKLRETFYEFESGLLDSPQLFNDNNISKIIEDSDVPVEIKGQVCSAYLYFNFLNGRNEYSCNQKALTIARNYIHQYTHVQIYNYPELASRIKKLEEANYKKFSNILKANELDNDTREKLKKHIDIFHGTLQRVINDESKELNNIKRETKSLATEDEYKKRNLEASGTTKKVRDVATSITGNISSAAFLSVYIVVFLSGIGAIAVTTKFTVGLALKSLLIIGGSASALVSAVGLGRAAISGIAKLHNNRMNREYKKRHVERDMDKKVEETLRIIRTEDNLRDMDNTIEDNPIIRMDNTIKTEVNPMDNTIEDNPIIRMDNTIKTEVNMDNAIIMDNTIKTEVNPTIKDMNNTIEDNPIIRMDNTINPMDNAIIMDNTIETEINPTIRAKDKKVEKTLLTEDNPTHFSNFISKKQPQRFFKLSSKP